MGLLSHFNAIDNILIRICAGCGTIMGNRTEFLLSQQSEILCEFCQSILDQYANDKVLENTYWKTHALYSWPVHGGSMLGKIVHQLKGSRNTKHFQYFADRLIQRHLSSVSELKKTNNEILVIPAPPREHRRRDHAATLAWEIKNRLDCRAGEFLKRASALQQKLKNKRKRWESIHSLMVATPSWSPEISKNRRVVFVDDLITTGATAMAAYLALGRPKHFEVWTIFRRPSLQVMTEIDITRQGL